jgi:hypothetical protein
LRAERARGGERARPSSARSELYAMQPIPQALRVGAREEWNA